MPYIGQSEDRQVEYPVLTGAVMWLTAQLVPSSDDADGPVPLVLRHQRARGSRSPRPWPSAPPRRWPAAGRGTRRCSRSRRCLPSPATINWDLYAVALLALGMLAWARERPVAAGVLIGLAAATKFYPLFVLGPLLVLCLRAGRMREFWTALVAAVVRVGAPSTCR